MSRPKKEKPIAILTINEDVSKMSKKEFVRLFSWILKIGQTINQKEYGKCRFRLMR